MNPEQSIEANRGSEPPHSASTNSISQPGRCTYW